MKFVPTHGDEAPRPQGRSRAEYRAYFSEARRGGLLARSGSRGWIGGRGQFFGRCTGLTLIETLISTALLGLLLVGVYSTLTLALRFQNKVHDSATTFQQAAAASSRIEMELGRGAATSLSVEPEGFAFVSASPDGGPYTHDAAGQLEWHRFIYFYREVDNRLLIGQVPFAPTSTLPTTPTLATLRADANASERLLAKGVTQLNVVGGSGADIEMRVEGESVEAKNAVTIRNRVTFRQ